MGPTLIDTRHLGREHAIGCWDLGGALVDPGPESSLETVISALEQPPQALLLTHIHLDHAGATGALVRRYPDLEVWVHARGAPHLIDPSKLIASAERLYGDDMMRLWGEIVPVPEQNIRSLSGGETVEVADRALDVAYTPGHASHHVIYFDRDDSTLYAGDVAGVRIPPSDFVIAPTPPPDIDIDLWQRSIELVRGFDPQRVALTHFGMAEDAERQLTRASEALTRQADVARVLVEQDLPADEAARRFGDELERRIRESSDADIAATEAQVSPARQDWLGLKRYWEKQTVG